MGSDHELVSADDCLAKLRAGLTLELRGSHDYLLPDCVKALNALPMIPQTLVLCTDDVFPDDLVERGGMIDLLRRLVRYGLDPVQAIRAATLNSAMRLKRDDLGLVGPGRRGDLIVLDDLAGLGVRHVLADGEPVAERRPPARGAAGLTRSRRRPPRCASPRSRLMISRPASRDGRTALSVSTPSVARASPPGPWWKRPSGTGASCCRMAYPSWRWSIATAARRACRNSR